MTARRKYSDRTRDYSRRDYNNGNPNMFEQQDYWQRSAEADEKFQALLERQGGVRRTVTRAGTESPRPIGPASVPLGGSSMGDV